MLRRLASEADRQSAENIISAIKNPQEAIKFPQGYKKGTQGVPFSPKDAKCRDTTISKRTRRLECEARA